jgi:hypothetical protein
MGNGLHRIPSIYKPAIHAEFALEKAAAKDFGCKFNFNSRQMERPLKKQTGGVQMKTGP